MKHECKLRGRQGGQTEALMINVFLKVFFFLSLNHKRKKKDFFYHLMRKVFLSTASDCLIHCIFCLFLSLWIRNYNYTHLLLNGCIYVTGRVAGLFKVETVMQNWRPIYDVKCLNPGF